MDKRHLLAEIIVTNENVIPVVQQHEELFPHIKDTIEHLNRRIDMLYRMDWVIILCLIAVLGEKAIAYLGKLV